MHDPAPQVINAVQGIRQDDTIIAFMGLTGVGKSYVIDLLTGQTGKHSANTLKSGTADIRATRVRHPDTGATNIVLVDTPGFDDTTRSDFEVLTMISKWLEKTYNRDVRLSGLVYVDRITNNRMAGAPYKNLRMFGNICGDAGTSRVLFLSTMWDRVKPDVGDQREKQLQEVFWKPFIDKGSVVERLKESSGKEAWRIVDKETNIHREREAVLLQEELFDLGRRLNESEAGKALYTDLQKFLAEQKHTLESFHSRLKNTNDEKLRKEVEKEYKKIQVQFEKTFDEVARLKIPVSKRLQNFFFKKKTKAKAIKVER